MGLGIPKISLNLKFFTLSNVFNISGNFSFYHENEVGLTLVITAAVRLNSLTLDLIE
jgi:hypothetical protein